MISSSRFLVSLLFSAAVVVQHAASSTSSPPEPEVALSKATSRPRRLLKPPSLLQLDHEHEGSPSKIASTPSTRTPSTLLGPHTHSSQSRRDSRGSGRSQSVTTPSTRGSSWLPSTPLSNPPSRESYYSAGSGAKAARGLSLSRIMDEDFEFGRTPPGSPGSVSSLRVAYSGTPSGSPADWPNRGASSRLPPLSRGLVLPDRMEGLNSVLNPGALRRDADWRKRGEAELRRNASSSAVVRSAPAPAAILEREESRAHEPRRRAGHLDRRRRELVERSFLPGEGPLLADCEWAFRGMRAESAARRILDNQASEQSEIGPTAIPTAMQTAAPTVAPTATPTATVDHCGHPAAALRLQRLAWIAMESEEQKKNMPKEEKKKERHVRIQEQGFGHNEEVGQDIVNYTTPPRLDYHSFNDAQRRSFVEYREQLKELFRAFRLALLDGDRGANIIVHRFSGLKLKGPTDEHAPLNSPDQLLAKLDELWAHPLRTALKEKDEDVLSHACNWLPWALKRGGSSGLSGWD